MSNFDNRIGIGRDTENKFRTFAEGLGFTVIETSQHLANQKEAYARHFPDFYLVEWRLFIQVKNGENSSKWENVLIEKASYNACMFLSKYARVACIWLFPDKSWQGHYIEKLQVIQDDISSEAKAHGSGTSAYKISKKNFTEFRIGPNTR